MRTDRLALVAVALIGCAALVLAQEKKPDAKPAAPAKKLGSITAVVGAEIHTVTKGVIKNGVILIQDGKILKVGGEDLAEGARRALRGLGVDDAAGHLADVAGGDGHAVGPSGE